MRLFYWRAGLTSKVAVLGKHPGFPGGSDWEESAYNAGDPGWTPEWERHTPPPEKRRATHSSVLAWRIPWTEEPGGPQYMGWQSDTAEHAHETALTWSHVVLCGPVSSVLVRFQTISLFLRIYCHCAHQIIFINLQSFYSRCPPPPLSVGRESTSNEMDQRFYFLI